jgi:hypothetical protein
MSVLIFISVFLGSFILDIVWTFCIRRIGQGKALQSAVLSSLITLTSALIIIEYTQNKLYLIPAVVGGFAGNYLAVKFDSKRKHKKIYKRSK